ncbi:hypothetical protein [Streptomyces panaciradicis]|uniref:hypothetical protein n=1 Tax=Streptomyces panaciradicis TaxID=1470261 RepID=UPI00201D08B4|nr:hypothetical protein [Streptomyces panaciradicis]MCL6674014.1 hypothetical protein [Streptomyces panaciradicis]
MARRPTRPRGQLLTPPTPNPPRRKRTTDDDTGYRAARCDARLAAVPLPSNTSHRGDGRPPRRFALELHVPDERHPELEAELHAAATTDGPHLRGSAGRWRVLDGWNKVSTGRRHEICIYRLEVQEAEPPITSASKTGD